MKQRHGPYFGSNAHANWTNLTNHWSKSLVEKDQINNDDMKRKHIRKDTKSERGQSDSSGKTRRSRNSEKIKKTPYETETKI